MSVSSKQRQKNKLIELYGNKCCACGQGDVWNGKPLTLQVHGHKKPLEERSLLCPNCHTQTDDYGWKSLTPEQRAKGGSAKGRTFTLEHRQAISNALIGRKQSAKAKEAQSKALKGIKRSDSWRRSLSQAAKASHKNKRESGQDYMLFGKLVRTGKVLHD